MRCEVCPEKDDCVSECNSMYDGEESIFDEDDHLYGDWLIDPEMGDH
jgi:hypothetical protein